jgi:hypothetical protein
LIGLKRAKKLSVKHRRTPLSRLVKTTRHSPLLGLRWLNKETFSRLAVFAASEGGQKCRQSRRLRAIKSTV